MSFSRKIIFIGLLGLMAACSPQNTTSVSHKCYHHEVENCCKDGCENCQKCKQTNCECVKCESRHKSTADTLLDKNGMKCEHYK